MLNDFWAFTWYRTRRKRMKSEDVNEQSQKKKRNKNEKNFVKPLNHILSATKMATWRAFICHKNGCLMSFFMVNTFLFVRNAARVWGRFVFIWFLCNNKYSNDTNRAQYDQVNYLTISEAQWRTPNTVYWKTALDWRWKIEVTIVEKLLKIYHRCLWQSRERQRKSSLKHLKVLTMNENEDENEINRNWSQISHPVNIKINERRQ